MTQVPWESLNQTVSSKAYPTRAWPSLNDSLQTQGYPHSHKLQTKDFLPNQGTRPYLSGAWYSLQHRQGEHEKALSVPKSGKDDWGSSILLSAATLLLQHHLSDTSSERAAKWPTFGGRTYWPEWDCSSPASAKLSDFRRAALEL